MFPYYHTLSQWSSDNIPPMFSRSEPLSGITEFDYYRNSHEKFKQESEEWLLKCMNNKQEKDENKSEALRTQGNSCFKKKEYFDCCYYYTKSLCFANRDGVNYGLALANRSAALYHIGDFESEYPKKLYPKLLVRKCYCLYRLKGENSDELKDCVESALIFVKNCAEFSQEEKDAHEKQFKNLDFKTVPTVPQILNIDDIEIPPITNGENKNFASASSLVRIRYEELNGRHVVATENIKCGDVLFVEKAFVFNLIPSQQAPQVLYNKCYYCLKDARASIPCPTCPLRAFCDEDCFQNSWETFHKYECLGMQANIWHELFLECLPFKAICLGLPSNFAEVKSNEIARFGSKEDNYPYFNSLLSHWRNSNTLEYSCESATKIITYLQQYTTFFEDLAPGIDVNYIGGLFIRHFCQVVCNAVLIKHWAVSNKCEKILNSSDPIGDAVFTSISLLNHSCEPNVNVLYVGDTAIVRAVKDIKKNEEVFRRYCFDYRMINKAQRNQICKGRYNFTCNCAVCNGSFHVETNVYKCPKCAWPFDESSSGYYEMCTNCAEPLTDFFLQQSNVILPLLVSEANDIILNLSILLEIEASGNRIFTKLHPFYGKLYEAFWKYYIHIGDFKSAIKYIQLHTEEETTIVREPRRAAVVLFRGLKLLHTSAKKKRLSLRSFQNEINALMEQCATMLQRYYPFRQSAVYRCLTE